GTGETALPLAYNRACYALRAVQLDRVLRACGVGLAGRRVLDVGCGTGFFTDFYLRRGADVTGLDLTAASVERLRRQFPTARFEQADVSDWRPDAAYDVVNAFDVLYHITDDERWRRAVRHLAAAVAPGGWFVLTDVFEAGGSEAAHNVTRRLATYEAELGAEGLARRALAPTHVLLNRPLGPIRCPNRTPWVLYAVDRTLLSMGLSLAKQTNRILLAQRPQARAS